MIVSSMLSSLGRLSLQYCLHWDDCLFYVVLLRRLSPLRCFYCDDCLYWDDFLNVFIWITSVKKHNAWNSTKTCVSVCLSLSLCLCLCLCLSLSLSLSLCDALPFSVSRFVQHFFMYCCYNLCFTGRCGVVASASECGSESREFESHQSHPGFLGPARLLAGVGAAMGPVGKARTTQPSFIALRASKYKAR